MSVSSDPYFPVMEHMTVKSIRQYLKAKQSILIPIGAIEQHGHHLPLDTDTIIARQLARRIGAQADMLVAPAMHQSFSGGMCPGTINISPAVMSLVISDMLLSLVSQGFRSIYLFLCHGGSENTVALNHAVQTLLRMNPAFADVMICILGAWDCDVKKTSYMKGFKSRDFHAGWVETSLMMALAPELVRMDELALDPEPVISQLREHPDHYQCARKIVDDPMVVPRLTQRDDVQIGVMGDPKQANVALGQQMVDELVIAGVQRIADIERRADGVYKAVPFTPEPLIF